MKILLLICFIVAMCLLTSLSHTVPWIGIEEEVYTVSEDDGVLEVCVVVFAPFYDCSEYIFRLSSTNDTAGNL